MAPLDFVMPPIHDNPSGWGPLPHFPLKGLENIPIETLAKSDRMARVADFTANAKGGGKGWGGPRVRADSEEEDFTLVDTHAPRPLGFSKGKGKGKPKGKGLAGGKFGKGFGKDEPMGINPRTGKPDPLFEGKGLPLSVLKGPKGKGKGPPKGKGKGKGRGGKNAFREWSVAVEPEWAVLEELNLPEQTGHKIKDALKRVTREDVAWCGALRQYDKAFDRVSPKLEKPLAKYDDICFYNVTAMQDPVIQEAIMDEDKQIDVAVTEQVLAALMTANRSVYSWDIVVTRAEDKVFLDKRDGSHIDYLTVNETSSDPPQNDDKEAINAPMKLGSEASAINQNFSQQVLNTKVPAKEMENANPFVDEDDDAAAVASCAYRYQKITLPGDEKSEDELLSSPVSLIVRSDVDCLMPESTPTQPIYGSIKTLNEYNAKGTTGWRYCIDSQRGAVLATELKNNSFKLARWTAQALIGGVDFLKLGYVTRKIPTDPGRHSILSVQTYKVTEFAQQIGLTADNAWGVVRNVVDTCRKLPPGKYLLLKDPTKSILRVYEVPWETFEEEEEDEEGEDDEFMDDEAAAQAPGKGPK
jgi:translation initiation factor 3 subunit D